MKKLLLALLSINILIISIATPVLAYSATGQICDSQTSNSPFCQKTSGNNPISGKGSVLAKVIDLITIAAGVASVIMLVIGGLQYVLSGGESTRINTAKNTIVYAIVGLVIVALGQILVALVINRKP